MHRSSSRLDGMIGRASTRRAAFGSVILALALLLSACGQTGGVVPPDTLTITVSASRAGGAQTYTVRDSAKVQGIYQHVLALPIIPPGASPACEATPRSYQFAFATRGTTVLTAAIVQCANILQLPHNVSRAPDSAFWTLVDSATGQRLEPR